MLTLLFIVPFSNSQYRDLTSGPDYNTRFKKFRPTPHLTSAKSVHQRCRLLSYRLVNLTLDGAVFKSVESRFDIFPGYG